MYAFFKTLACRDVGTSCGDKTCLFFMSRRATVFAFRLQILLKRSYHSVNDMSETLWQQTILTIKAKSRGVHNITDEIQKLPELKDINIGLANLLIQHTSASISLNECWDPSVRDDMEMILNRLAPENAPYKHTLEGPDDMPGTRYCEDWGGLGETIWLTLRS